MCFEISFLSSASIVADGETSGWEEEAETEWWEEEEDNVEPKVVVFLFVIFEVYLPFGFS